VWDTRSSTPYIRLSREAFLTSMLLTSRDMLIPFAIVMALGPVVVFQM
jgi:hypothetical protein